MSPEQLHHPEWTSAVLALWALVAAALLLACPEGEPPAAVAGVANAERERVEDVPPTTLEGVARRLMARGSQEPHDGQVEPALSRPRQVELAYRASREHVGGIERRLPLGERC